MVITRRYAAINNIKLYEGLPLKKKNIYKNDESHYVFRFLMLIWFFTIVFTISTIAYHYLFRDNDKSLYNFVITDLPEKTILQLYNSIPARPYNELPTKTYNYILDMFQDYNIDYF
jgi:hypothetical protein